MIIPWSLGRYRFPIRFLVPVHVIINVSGSVAVHAAPYADIPFHASPESLFSCLSRYCTLFQHMIRRKVLSFPNDIMKSTRGRHELALSVRLRKAFFIEEKLMTFTSLNEEKTVLNCTLKVTFSILRLLYSKLNNLYILTA